MIVYSLPATGKTHVSRSLCRYLKWLGVSTKVFSVGNYRRKLLGQIPNEMFDPSKVEKERERDLHNNILIKKGMMMLLIQD